MELFERSRATDQLSALGERWFPEDALPGPSDWQHHFSLAAHRHTLPWLLDRTKAAVKKSGGHPSLVQGLHHIALWAGDTATALETAARMARETVRLLRDPDRKERLRRQGTALAKSTFTPETCWPPVREFLGLAEPPHLAPLDVATLSRPEIERLLGAQAFIAVDEISVFVRYAAASTRLLEIGAAYGASSFLLLATSPAAAKVWSVDPFTGDSMVRAAILARRGLWDDAQAALTVLPPDDDPDRAVLVRTVAAGRQEAGIRFEPAEADRQTFARLLDIAPRPDLLRLGGDARDSGAWVVAADRLGPESVCCLAGVGEDITFDCALVTRFGCRACQLDPTPRAVHHVVELGRLLARGDIDPADPVFGKYAGLTPEAFGRLTHHPLGLFSRPAVLRFHAPTNPEHAEGKNSSFLTVGRYRSRNQSLLEGKKSRASP